MEEKHIAINLLKHHGEVWEDGDGWIYLTQTGAALAYRDQDDNIEFGNPYEIGDVDNNNLDVDLTDEFVETDGLSIGVKK